ncbi:hypothetical protein PIB30_095804, partial [Stylosanthes scabra]|nr:hypothetical protein [Stylosanthes scabra]
DIRIGVNSATLWWLVSFRENDPSPILELSATKLHFSKLVSGRPYQPHGGPQYSGLVSRRGITHPDEELIQYCSAEEVYVGLSRNGRGSSCKGTPRLKSEMYSL